MRRLTDRLRDFVGKGHPEEASSPGAKAPAEAATPAAQATTPSPASAMGASMTVEAAYSMLNAFPKDTDDAQRFPALRSALLATLEKKHQTLQQLLAEVLQEKARIASILLNQEKNFDLQQAKITEAVDALWEKREKLTEHHQRITLQGNERISGLDQLIQCLSLPDEATQEPTSLTSLFPPKVEVVAPEDDGPVILRMPRMELRPLGESPSPDEEAGAEPSPPEAEPRPNNPRKLYSRSAA